MEKTNVERLSKLRWLWHWKHCTRQAQAQLVIYLCVSVFPRLGGCSTRGKTWTLESDSMVTWIGLIRICYGQPYCSDSGLGWAMAMKGKYMKDLGQEILEAFTYNAIICQITILHVYLIFQNQSDLFLFMRNFRYAS